MKNKLFQRFFVATLVVLSSTANVAHARNLLHPQSDMGRLLLSMIVTVIVFFVLFVVLTIYNKFFVPHEVKNFKLNKDSLRTPQDKDEAVIMFLTKNKLK